MSKCCVPSCRNSWRTHKLLVLPKDKELRIKWCMAISREDLIDVDLKQRNNYRVCEVHFMEHDKIGGPSNRRYLKCAAFPCLKLPDIVKQKNMSVIPTTLNNEVPKVENPFVNPIPRTSRTSENSCKESGIHEG